MKRNNNNVLYFQYCLFTIILLFIIYLFFTISIKEHNIIIKNNIPPQTQHYIDNNYNPFGLYNKKNDVYLNPYTPPLKNNYISCQDKIPININTNQSYMGNIDYKQVGILTSNTNKTKILPLFSRPIYRNRNNYNYYTTDDKNGIKLPILFHKKSCLTENGCDEIYNNDKVYVKGYNDFFNADIYENETMKYLPFL